MGLNLNSSGSYTPHIRYMASTSSWSMSSDNGVVPFSFTQAIFDLENIQTGWCLIAEGEAPQWVMDEALDKPAKHPNDGSDWKRGFKVNVYSEQLFGAQPMREFGTSGKGAVMGIQELYKQYEEQKDANTGLVPVVEYKGSVAKKVGKGNTSIPNLVIVKFIERPAGLSADGEQVVASQDTSSDVSPVAQEPNTNNNYVSEF